MNCRVKLLNYFRQRSRGWVLSLFAAVCIIYLPFLGSPFVFDDLPFFFGDIVDHYTHHLFRFELRWLPYASLAWTSAIFSDVLPHFFRLGNMLLHVSNAILLFFLLRQLVLAVLTPDINHPAVTWGAWFGALIFACHPTAVYAVGYLIERSILMATLFSLVMQLAYLRGLLTGQKRWFVLAVSAYFLACFSKEHSVMVPALLAAQHLLLRDRGNAAIVIMDAKITAQVLWPTWILFITIAVFVVLSSRGVFGIPYEPMAANLFEQYELFGSAPIMHLLSTLTQTGLFFKYLLLWWIPNPAWMSVDMREHFIPDWSAWQDWLGAVSFMLYGILGCWLLLLRSRWMKLAGFALLYPWLQFMVELPPVRVQEPFVLYRSYLWLPGMMLFFPLLLAKMPSRKILLGLGFVVTLLVPLAWNRLWVFADNYRLWNDAALLLHSGRELGADRIFYNRGSAELGEKKWGEAAADFQRSVVLSPKLAQIRYVLGLAYLNMKRNQDALAQFEVAIALKPEDASFYYAKGLALKRLNQDELAMDQMKKSCELKSIMACSIVEIMQVKK